MRIKNQLLPFAIAGLMTFGFTSCSDDDDGANVPDVIDMGEEDGDNGDIVDATELTIAGFVSGNDDYELLLAAVDYAGLTDTLNSDSVNLTVFAPNDAAFETWLDGAALTDFTPEQVEQVLLNHVINSELKAADVVGAVPTYQKTMATGPNDLSETATFISTFISSDLMVNGKSEITGPDAFDATNGIIHAVDTVIDLPNIITFAQADERLSILTQALITEELVEAIEGLNPATVLAPINEAFGMIPSTNVQDLGVVLTYHVINGINAVAADVAGLTETPETLQGGTIAVGEGPTFTGSSNTTDASVVIADIQAINGVVHVIDTVLLP